MSLVSYNVIGVRRDGLINSSVYGVVIKLS